MRYAHVLVFLALMLRAASYAQTTGLIEGIVTDSNGVRVASATVYARLEGVFVFRAIVPHASTDEEARYRLPLPFGRYSLAAGKPEEGYPDTLYDHFYYGFTKRPEVVLSSTKKKAIANLRLGNKAGILVGTVVDAFTGEPINANVEFRWISDPRIAISGSGLANAQFRILIPSDTPLSMVVSQAGYENWVHSSEYPGTELALQPGESLSLDIRLKPSHPTALSP